MLATIRIAIVIGGYWFIAITMLFITKHLMSGPDVTTDISVLLVWLQNMIAVGCVLAFHLLFNFLGRPWHGPRFDPSSLLLPDMILASMTFTGTLIFNNLMLKYISVAFYQVARSLTLIFVIAFSTLFLKERFTPPTFLSSFFIIMGFYISVDVEVVSEGIKVVGIVYGILASLFAALCGVFFKRIQKLKQLPPLQISFNNSVISFVAMSPLVCSTGQLQAFGDSPAMSSSKVWTLIVLSGTVSFLMGWISALQISTTTPMTHNISINAKSVVQTVIAILWLGESRSWTWWLGNVLVMSGIGIYMYSKVQSSHQALKCDEEIAPPGNENDGIKDKKALS